MRTQFLKPFAVIACLAGGLALAPAALGALVVSAGDVSLRPNMAGQAVQFFVTGSDAVAGLELDIQVGDGGSDLGGTNVGPTITSIDLITGTAFQVDSAAQADVVTFPRARQSTVDIAGSVTADAGTGGLIATVVFDTTGQTPGTYDLLLSGVAGSFSTQFFAQNGDPIQTTVTNGTVEITPVPEPASLGLLAVGGLTLLRRRR